MFSGVNQRRRQQNESTLHFFFSRKETEETAEAASCLRGSWSRSLTLQFKRKRTQGFQEESWTRLTEAERTSSSFSLRQISSSLSHTTISSSWEEDDEGSKQGHRRRQQSYFRIRRLEGLQGRREWEARKVYKKHNIHTTSGETLLATDVFYLSMKQLVSLVCWLWWRSNDEDRLTLSNMNAQPSRKDGSILTGGTRSRPRSSWLILLKEKTIEIEVSVCRSLPMTVRRPWEERNVEREGDSLFVLYLQTKVVYRNVVVNICQSQPRDTVQDDPYIVVQKRQPENENTHKDTTEIAITVVVVIIGVADDVSMMLIITRNIPIALVSSLLALSMENLNLALTSDLLHETKSR